MAGSLLQQVSVTALRGVSPAAADKPELGSFGIDMAGMDRRFTPSNDWVLVW